MGVEAKNSPLSQMLRGKYKEFTTTNTSIYISITEQKLLLLKNKTILRTYRISSAAARASTVPALAVSASLVQAVVQAEGTLSVSPFAVALATGSPLLDTLGVTGSSPVAPTHKS